ncbi:MAG: alpha-galactosidase [Propionibacteriaceae bacterium]|jgi:alpha-galactosidase|nr:alpha-galactosidase [Propionibacteriaceae bacterium]
MTVPGTRHTGLIDCGDISLSFSAPGEPRRLGPAEFLFPAGALRLAHPFGDTEFFRHGWNSWSPSGWRRLSQPPLRIGHSPQRLLTADDARNDTPLAHSGSAVGVLAAPNGRCLILGALGLGAPRVGATDTTLWGRHEDPDGEWFLAYGDERAVFDRYAALVGDRLGRGQNRAGRVWSSWYSYYDAIDEALVGQVVAGLDGLPFDVVQLDDGWERAVGDWTPNARFPSGMAATADTIRRAGFRPGLWLAPLIALPASDFVRQRPDLLIQDPDGGPLIAGYNWGGPYHALDTTAAEVQDHLRALCATVRGWGFSYLKLDFMYAAALEGRRRMEIHRERAYRQAVALIRQAVGPDTYLLGCGVPLLASAGLIDGARVGPDVAAFWTNAERPDDPSGVGARNALLASVHRAWWGGVFETDPDAVYFRRSRSLLDADQRQALQDLATVLGFKSTSDAPAWLAPAERAELRAWLEARETVRQTGRYSFEVDGRSVDLGRFVTGYRPPPSTVAN